MSWTLLSPSCGLDLVLHIKTFPSSCSFSSLMGEGNLSVSQSVKIKIKNKIKRKSKIQKNTHGPAVQPTWLSPLTSILQALGMIWSVDRLAFHLSCLGDRVHTSVLRVWESKILCSCLSHDQEFRKLHLTLLAQTCDAIASLQNDVVSPLPTATWSISRQCCHGRSHKLFSIHPLQLPL